MFKKTVYSHPDRLLEDHLNGVRANALALFDFFVGETDFRCLRNAVERAALYHDIGKALDDFQRYITGNSKKAKSHSKPSSEFIAMLSGFACDEERFLSAESVRRHHTSIRNKQESIDDWDNSSTSSVEEIAGLLMDKAGFCSDGFEEISEYLEDLTEEIENAETYFKLRTVYSILITADRFDAVVKDALRFDKTACELKPSAVENFIKKLPESDLSEWRSRTRSESLERFRKKIKKSGVYTLTLPTGAGKTLLSLQMAVESARQFKKKSIIYVLPFITIVDQTTELVESIYGKDVVYGDHHLAFIRERKKKESKSGLKGDEYEPVELKSRFTSTFRYWFSPIVITTLAKFWSVIYSPYANDTMNFHRLADAVVIIDEPQSIPVNLWKGFGETLNFLADKLNTIFLLMTATQPKIVESNESLEIAPQNIQIPKKRYTIEFLNDERKWEVDRVSELLEVISEKEVNLKNSSVMLIFNTRKSALKGFYSIVKGPFGVEPYFLSRWVVPYERLRRLDEIKEKLKKGEKLWLVSTQVVEAGVDIDFDVVVRDIAPLDSIVQAAGRCNRNGRLKEGKVFVAEFFSREKNDKLKKTAFYVYDSILITKTEEILRNNSVLPETEVPEVLKTYYEIISDEFLLKGNWNTIKKGEWGEYRDLYSFGRIPSEGLVFVDLKDGEVQKELEELLERKVTLENLDDYKRRWAELQMYSIEVPENEIQKLLNENSSDSSFFVSYNGGVYLITSDGVGDDGIYRENGVGFVPYEVRVNEGILGDDDWV